MSRCASCRSPLVHASTGRPRRYCSDRCRVAAWRKRRRRSVHFSSKTDEWPTPRDFFEELEAEFGPFELDPCATPQNAKCERYFTRADDGLSQEWTGRVFMNPPYGSQISRWVQKAREAAEASAELVVCLVPARTDTRWWHDHAACGDVRFLRGRLKFGGSDTAAPFPSALLVFRNAAFVTKPQLALAA